MKNSYGFTLLEFLVALVILTMLSLFSYRTINTLLVSDKLIKESLLELNGLQKIFSFITKDCLQEAKVSTSNESNQKKDFLLACNETNYFWSNKVIYREATHHLHGGTLDNSALTSLGQISSARTYYAEFSPADKALIIELSYNDVNYKKIFMDLSAGGVQAASFLKKLQNGESKENGVLSLDLKDPSKNPSNEDNLLPANY